MKETIIITRGQMGQWAGYLGAICGLLGIIGLLWQGGLTAVVAGLLLVGAAGIAAWGLLAPREFIGFITGRQTRYSSTAVFGALLLIGIVSLTYIILQRAALTLDMTQGQRFTLSPESTAILSRVTRPIRIIGFYGASGLRLRAVDDQFFRLYEAATNGLITREYIDPDEQPARARAFAAVDDGDLYLAYLDESGQVDMTTLARIPRGGNQERDMTGAIARLLAAGTLTVYFETGRGALNALSSENQGLSGINNGMRESGVITAPLKLAELAQTGASIPANAAAVILPRPTTDLSADEIAVLDAYLRSGGALLILADALFNDDAFLKRDGLFSDYLWQNYGLRPYDAVVVENTPAATAGTPLDIISAAVFTDNDIAARLDSENAPTLFRVARAIEVNDSPPDDVSNGRIIMTSPDSYGETNFQALAQTNTYAYDAGQDIPGPLTTVAWATNNSNKSRILLIGDADFATNGLIMTGGNSLLFTDGVTWLTRFGERISFAPQAFSSGLPLILVSTEQLDLIAFFTVIVMPALVLLAGLAVWTRRRRAR